MRKVSFPKTRISTLVRSGCALPVRRPIGGLRSARFRPACHARLGDAERSRSFFAQPGATSGDPRHRVDTNDQFIDNFSWKAGKHDVKLGFDFRRTSIEQYFDKYFRGRLQFADLSSFLEGDPEGGGLAFQYSGNSKRHTFENSFGLYLQDASV